jgi:hypothetical protein
VERLTLVLWASDVPALARFLETVAGGVAEARHPGFAALQLGNSRVEVHADESYRGHPWYDALGREGIARGIGAELRVQVEDVEETFAAALRAGVTTIHGPMSTGESYECAVMGPDGYLFSFWRADSAGVDRSPNS